MGVGGAMGMSVGADVRVLADALGVLFERDRHLAVELNAAQRRLLGANGRLRVRLSADALCAPLGATRPDRGLAGRGPAVLEGGSPATAMEEVADAIRRAFSDYQHAAEERRILAADIGEAIVPLVDVLIGAGFSDGQARRADMSALRDGVYREA